MKDKDRPGVIVIGVGNVALSDEGVGVHVAREVARRAPAGVEVVSAGLPGPGLVELLRGRRKAVIVDAIDADRSPGEVFSFLPEDVICYEQARHYSLHEGNILQYVQLAKALECAPKELVLIGIQPRSVALGEKLSADVEAAVPEAASVVIAEASR